DPADASDIAALFTSLTSHGDSNWATIAAAAIRSAVGLAAANLDAQFGAISISIDPDAVAAAIIAQFGISGSAASASVSLASSDVDGFNLALDLLKEPASTAFTDDTAVALWGARNYVTARNAELREHPWKFAIKRKVLYPTDFVLDGIGGTLTG